jgi:sec-independent protein translocase protein TatC
MAASDIASDAALGRALGTTASAPGGGEPEEEEEGATMTLLEHLEELRKRLIFCCIAIVVASVLAFLFWEPILRFLLTPLPSVAIGLPHNSTQKLVQHEIGEAFMIALKLALAAGIALASPVVLYQVWAFIAPGLTRRERRYAVPFTSLGVGLFVIGLAVGFVTLRFPINWLIGFGSKDYFLLIDADSYFTFVAYFLLAFGITFELPLVLTFLSVVGVVNSRQLRAKRMYILFGLWFLACVITPGADPYSPLIVGVALTVLFELSIILMRVLRR